MKGIIWYAALLIFNVIKVVGPSRHHREEEGVAGEVQHRAAEGEDEETGDQVGHNYNLVLYSPTRGGGFAVSSMEHSTSLRDSSKSTFKVLGRIYCKSKIESRFTLL